MDYPHPARKAQRRRDDRSVRRLRRPGIGEWDKVAIAVRLPGLPARHRTNPPALKKIVDDAWKQDLIYMSNQDLDATPRVDQWNNGTDVAAELTRIMAVRRAALTRFDETVIKKDAPMATMEEALVPLYMYHRYAVESAASAIGGPGLHLRVPRRRPHSDQVGLGRAAARRAHRAGEHPGPLGAGAAEERAPEDPAASVRLGHASGAVHAIHRESVRPDQPGVGRGGRAPSASSCRPIARPRMVAQHAVDPTLPGLEDVIDGAAQGDIRRAGIDRLRARNSAAPRRACWWTASWPSRQDRRCPRSARSPRRAIHHIWQPLRPNTAAGRLGSRHVMAADIKRFLERRSRPINMPSLPDAPPGAANRRSGMDWLTPVGWCTWDWREH
jgi:hypothetical protein